jgi:pentatricopeptide repeat protein
LQYYAGKGMVDEALAMFNSMRDYDIKPDAKCAFDHFLTILFYHYLTNN